MSTRVFKGRVVVKGRVTAEALVSKGGFNTLASYQHSLMFGDRSGKCSDQNNVDLYKRPMAGKALCMPQTIGSTTAAAGAILADVWTDNSMPTVDGLGEDFLSYVQTGDRITVDEDGTVTVER